MALVKRFVILDRQLFRRGLLMRSSRWPEIRGFVFDLNSPDISWNLRHFLSLAVGMFLWRLLFGTGFREGLTAAGLIILIGTVWHFYSRFAVAYRNFANR